MTGPAAPDGAWLPCPWCGGPVPLGHLVRADHEPGIAVAVCPGCGRRATHVVPVAES